jgi:hypothetical protein
VLRAGIRGGERNLLVEKNEPVCPRAAASSNAACSLGIAFAFVQTSETETTDVTIWSVATESIPRLYLACFGPPPNRSVQP